MGGEAGRAPNGGLRSCACSRTGWGRHHHHHHVIKTSTSSGLRVPDDPVRQSNLDSLFCSALIAALKPILSQHRLACFVAATWRESGAWLNCLPNTAIGCRLDNDSFRLAVSIRLGLRVYTPHRCRFGTRGDEYGLHQFHLHSASVSVVCLGVLP